MHGAGARLPLCVQEWPGGESSPGSAATCLMTGEGGEEGAGGEEVAVAPSGHSPFLGTLLQDFPQEILRASGAE